MNKIKKLKNIFAVAIISFISLFAFAGCGTEGASAVKAIFFVKDIYYVDLNVETFLDYKVYPATSSGYEATFSLDNDYIDDSRYFKFSNGSVLVTGEKFSGIVVHVNINDIKDSCEVKLREYPSQIEFEQSTQTLVGGGVKTLELKGKFKSGIRNCGQGEFNYKIKSSNPSVIEIVDSENLVIASTGKGGSSDVTVEILNAKGESCGLVATTKIECQNNISDSFAVVGNSVVKNNSQLDLIARGGENFVVGVRYFDAEQFLIDGIDFDVLLSNHNVFEVSEQDGKKVLTVIGEGEVKVTIQSTGVNTSGVPSKIVFKITVQFSA